MAKVLVFQAAVDAGLEELVIVAVLASVVAAFFIRLIVLTYMYEPEGKSGAGPDGARPGPGPGRHRGRHAGLRRVPSLLLGFLERAAVLRW